MVMSLILGRLELKMCMHAGGRVLTAMRPCGQSIHHIALCLQRKVALIYISYSLGSLFSRRGLHKVRRST